MVLSGGNVKRTLRGMGSAASTFYTIGQKNCRGIQNRHQFIPQGQPRPQERHSRKAGVELQKSASPDRVGTGAGGPVTHPFRQSRSTPVRGVPIEWNDLPRRKIIEGKVLGSSRATCVQSSVTASVKAPAIRERISKLELTTTGLDALVLFEVGSSSAQVSCVKCHLRPGRIGEYQEINIGWALDGGQGLVVPVVRSCDQRSVQEIASPWNANSRHTLRVH